MRIEVRQVGNPPMMNLLKLGFCLFSKVEKLEPRIDQKGKLLRTSVNIWDISFQSLFYAYVFNSLGILHICKHITGDDSFILLFSFNTHFPLLYKLSVISTYELCNNDHKTLPSALTVTEASSSCPQLPPVTSLRRGLAQ